MSGDSTAPIRPGVDEVTNDKERPAVDPKMNPNEDGLTFEAWMTEVNKHLMAMSGLTADCLADYPSYDYWNDSVPPKAAAVDCLVEYNDFPEDLLGAVWTVGR